MRTNKCHHKCVSGDTKALALGRICVDKSHQFNSGRNKNLPLPATQELPQAAVRMCVLTAGTVCTDAHRHWERNRRPHLRWVCAVLAHAFSTE